MELAASFPISVAASRVVAPPALDHHYYECPFYLPYAMETMFTTVLSVAVAASITLLAQTPVISEPDAMHSVIEMRLIMVPLIGGILTMLGAVFLNPSVETAQIKVGRACFGVFVGILSPQLFGWFHPGLKEIGTNPFMLLSIGGVSALVGFIMSRPAVHWLYNRSPKIVDRALSKAEDRYIPKDSDP